MPELGVETIGWTGGEPLIRKDLEELITYAHSLGIDSGITTNGILLTRKRVDSIAKAGVNSFQISLDGSTAERNRDIRGARLKDFQLIIDGIKMSVEAGLPVHMAMLIGLATLDDVIPYIDLARELGVTSVRFCGFVPHGSATDDEVRKRLDYSDQPEKLAELIDRLLDVESPRLIFDPAHGPLPPSYEFHKCIAGVGTFYISDNGNVYPCTGLLGEQFLIDNLRNRPLPEIVRDPKMSEMAGYNRDGIHGHCRECPYFRVCRGACRGAVYAHTGDLNASFPVCLFRASQNLS